MSKIFVGTSGWNYNHWKKVFYPEKMASSKWLDHYAKNLDSVELNVTFYRLVKKETFKHWHDRTPKNFHFVAKGSRFITHIKKIKSVAQPLSVFLRNVVYLKEKLSAILWQFPPSFRKDHKKLEIFLKLLARKTGVRQVFEFRHSTWFDQDVYSLLKKYNACLCVAHSDRYPCVRESTADFIYLRFHGGSLYRTEYTDEQLKEWGEYAISTENKDIFAFFNNDAQGFAVKNALRFREILNSRRKMNRRF